MMEKTKAHIRPVKHTLLDDRLLKVIQHDYLRSSSRILFLDYDGTLVPFKLDPKSAVPEQEILTLITSIAQDPRNEVVIISGRDMKYLDTTFSGIPVSIVSEHGYQVRTRRGALRGKEPGNWAWKTSVMDFLQPFTRRYLGSFIEEKQASLAFHFRGSLYPVVPEDIRLLK